MRIGPQVAVQPVRLLRVKPVPAGKTVLELLLHAFCNQRHGLLLADGHQQPGEEPGLLAGQTDIRRAARQEAALSGYLLHGLRERLLRLLLNRVAKILHSGKIAEDGLGGAAERLRHGARVHSLHALPAKHGKRSFQNHFPCNSLFRRHILPSFSLNWKFFYYITTLFGFRQPLTVFGIYRAFQ